MTTLIQSSLDEMPQSFSEAERLSAVIVEISANLVRWPLQLYSDKSSIKNKDSLTLHHIFNEIKDIKLVFILIRDYLDRLTVLQNQIFVEFPSKKNEYSRDNLEDVGYLSLMDQYFFTFEVIPVLIKNCFHILCNIDNLIDQNQTLKNKMAVLRPKIKRLLIYRDRAITHRIPGGVVGGLRVSNDVGKVEIMSSFVAEDELVIRIQKLFISCKQYLPPEIQEQQNIHEQLSTIYKHFNDIHDSKLKQEFKIVVEKFGVISPQPSEVGDLILSTMNALMSI